MSDRKDLVDYLGSEDLADELLEDALKHSRETEAKGFQFKEVKEMSDEQELTTEETATEETEVKETEEVKETDEKATLAALSKKLEAIAKKVEDAGVKKQIEDIAKQLTEYGYGYEAPKKETEEETIQEVILPQETVTALVDEIAARLQIKDLSDAVAGLKSDVKELSKTEDERIAEKIRHLPKAVIRDTEQKATTVVKDEEIIEPESEEEADEDVPKRDKIFKDFSEAKF